MLSKGGSRAVDDSTVEFTLDAPNGNFPYLASSDNYNSIILPKDYDGDWDSTFIGTGPWKLGEYRPGEGITLVPNEQYWDPARKPLAEKAEVVFFGNEQSLILGFQGNQVDVVVAVLGVRAARRCSPIRRSSPPSSSPRLTASATCACDIEPFNDKRVRQAVALLVNRGNLVDGLLDTKTDIGNDSPFAPVFPSTSPDVRQREQDVAEARKLLDAAGVADGFSVTLSTWQGFEMPDYAQLLQQDLRAGNIRLNLSITDAGTYYGDATFGNSPGSTRRWASPSTATAACPTCSSAHRCSATARGTAPTSRTRRTTGCSPTTWPPSTSTPSGRRPSRSRSCCSTRSPILFTYFYYFLSGAKDYVAGVETTAMGHTDVSQTGFI